MGILNQAIGIGRSASESFDDNNTIINKQKEIGKLKEQNAADHQKHISEVSSHKNINASLAETNRKLLKKANDLGLENQNYKELLAKPLGDILQENADYKKAYEEQQALIAMWMLRQRAMKKVAFDLAKKLNIGEENIIDSAKNLASRVIEKNEDLEGTISSSNMQFFQKHKDYLLREM